MYDRLLPNHASAQAVEESPRLASQTWQALIDELDLTARVGRAETEYMVKHPLPEVTLERLQSCLDEQTAYVGWLDVRFADDLSASTGPFIRGRWMYIVRRNQPVQWIRISETSSREEESAFRPDGEKFAAILTRAASWRERLEVDPELMRVSRTVYGHTFGAQTFDLRGIKRLVAEVACYAEWIYTDLLVDPDGHYLSERYAVSYSPSAAVYVALSESPRRQRKVTKVLAIGDPTFAAVARSSLPTGGPDSRIDDVVLRGAVNHDTATLEKLPPLPYAGRELDRVQALFSHAQILRGDDATELAINRLAAKDELADFDIVHIASHALVDRLPERCAVAFSRAGVDGSVSNDGLVGTQEIRMGWKLDADLVTLSACQTAGGFAFGEPAGFSQALFQAGARCVLLTLWKVDDEATSLLMSRFYENVAAYGKKRNAISYSDALAEAKNWLRAYTNNKGERPFAHPIYWAGFVLIGDAN
jgi:hypothetical protein